MPAALETAVEPGPRDDARGKPSGRVRSLDAVRGFAALGTVLWHYQHFQPTSYPYTDVLLLFYRQGWRLVDLFFALSGFVFFMNYEAAIDERRIDFRRFLLLRISRLYPLHVATLVVVAGLQLTLYLHTGAFKIYQTNDLSHFVLNLLMLQFAWLEKTFSFNGPSWSLSIEFFLYIVFFAVCLVPRQRRNVVIAIIALFGAKLVRGQVDTFVPLVNMTFGRGLVGFFLGGVAFRVHTALRASPGWRRPVLGACLAYIAVSVTIVWASEAGVAIAKTFEGDLPIIQTALFFAIVLVAAETPSLGRIRPLAFLGDISYSVYLTHVPLQLALFVVQSYGHPMDFSRPAAFWAFFGGLVVLSTLSYRGLEVPSMRAIRRAMGKPTS